MQLSDGLRRLWHTRKSAFAFELRSFIALLLRVFAVSFYREETSEPNIAAINLFVL